MRPYYAPAYERDYISGYQRDHMTGYAQDPVTRRLIGLRRRGDRLKALLDAEKRKLQRVKGGGNLERMKGDEDLERLLASHITWLASQNAEIERQTDHLLMQSHTTSSAPSWMLRCR